MNLPNKLSLLRMILVPIFMIVLALPDAVMPMSLSAIIGAVIFIVASITDCLDGKIARKYNLITDFGKLIDPLADKFMVIGALIMILYRATSLRAFFVLALTVVVFRELAVTAMRLITASKSGVAVPANMLGKIKTVSQMVGTVVMIVEPVIPFFKDNHILSYVCMGIMAFTTLFSGIDYLKAYLPHIVANQNEK